MFKTTKKLAIASAVAMMFAGSAHAITFDDLVVPTADTFSSVASSVGSLLATSTPDVTALSGAINTGIVNGAIDISGTNVSFGSVAANVTAAATAVGTTASSEAYAIAGAKLSTTVIGAMNSATVDLMGKVTDQTDSVKVQLGIGSLAAASGAGSVNVSTPAVAAGSLGLGGGLAAGNILTSSGTDLSLANLTSETTNHLTNKVNELQKMNVFNTAINVASLDAGIRIAAGVDANAWFLNPQTGVVNLSNIAMTTTAIGAMNSSITRLGANLAK